MHRVAGKRANVGVVGGGGGVRWQGTRASGGGHSDAGWCDTAERRGGLDVEGSYALESNTLLHSGIPTFPFHRIP